MAINKGYPSLLEGQRSVCIDYWIYCFLAANSQWPSCYIQTLDCTAIWRRLLHSVRGAPDISNAAYKAYKHRESAARSFQVLPSSDTVFLVTTTCRSQYIVNLPLITPEVRRQGHCECQKYDDFTAPCVHAIACILYLSRDPFPYFSPQYD